MQKNYDFRQELLQWHRPSLRDPDYVPEEGSVLIDHPFTIVIGADSGEVIQTAAKDLQDYLLTSMGCSVALRRAEDLSAVPAYTIVVATKEQLGKDWHQDAVPASYEITVEADRVTVCGIDARGCAQGQVAAEEQRLSCHVMHLPIKRPRLPPMAIACSPAE